MNPDLVTMSERLTARRADLLQRAKDATAQAGVYKPPTGSYAQVSDRFTPIYVPPARGAAFVPLANQVADSFNTARLDQDQSGYNRLEASMASDHMSNQPDPDAPLDEKMTWAQAGTQIPSLAPTMKAYMQDQLINEPDRVAAREAAAQKAKEDREQRAQTARDQMQNRIDTANIMAAAMGSRMRPQAIPDGQGGLLTFDPRTQTYTPAKLADGTPVVKLTPAQSKQEGDISSQMTNASNGLDQLDVAEGILKDLIAKKSLLASGGAITSIRDTLAGKVGYSTETAQADIRLKKIAANLALSFPTQGQATDKKTALAQDASGSLGKEGVPYETQLAALEQVRENLKQRAQRSYYPTVGSGSLGAQQPTSPSTPGGNTPGASSVNAALDKLLAERGEPTGSFVGTPDQIQRAINGIRDPGERMMAYRAWQNQQKAATAPAPSQPAPSGSDRTVVRRGRLNGRPVVKYSDGSTEYAD
jgi:hypothetical protein